MSSKKEYGIEEHIYETLLDLYKLECSEAFRFPVDIHLFKCPDYYQIITDPMDLSTLTTKYKDGAYKTFNEIKEQIDKIIKNCRKFNTDPNHTILKTCSKFEQCFNTRWNKLNEIRIQLEIPDDYQLKVEMNKLDSIEQRKNKKKEPASLKEDQVGRKPRLPKNEIKTYNNNQFTFTKPQNEFVVNKFKIKSSSIQDDDQPYIDSNTSIKNESQNFQDNQFESKIQKKEVIESLPPTSFKVSISRMTSNDLGQNQEKIKETPPIQLNNFEPLQRQDSTKSTLSFKIPIPKLNQPQQDTIKDPLDFQIPNIAKSNQTQQQQQPIPKQIQLPIQQTNQSISTESQNQVQLQQQQQKIQIPTQQLTSQQPQQSINNQQSNTQLLQQPQVQQQPQLLGTQQKQQQQQQLQQSQQLLQQSQQLQQPQLSQQSNQVQIQKQQLQQQNIDDQKAIPKKVEIKKEQNEFAQQNSVASLDQQHPEILPKISINFNNPSKNTLLESKTQSYETKITIPKQQPQQLINTSSSQLPSQKQFEKSIPIIKGTTQKLEMQNTPNTPKGKRKIIDSDDSQDSSKIEQIPIIKKPSEKKIEYNETPIQHSISGPSSEKKIPNIGSHTFSLNEQDNKVQPKENQSFKLAPTTPPAIQPPQKIEAPPSKYVFKIDVNAIQKLENDHNQKKIEKNKKYALKLMSILKKHIIARQPNIEILNRCLEVPSKTTLNMILMWLKQEFDKIPFQEYITIAKFVELAYQSIQKFKCEEEPQNEQLLQQYFNKEKEQEQNRLKKIEQETKVQQEPIILEKIDIEMLSKSLRIRSKKKKVNDKEKKDRDTDKQKDSDKQQQKPVLHQQQEIQSFALENPKKIKLDQQQQQIQDIDDDFEEQTQAQDWWKILEKKKNECKAIEEEKKEKEDQEQEEKFFVRTLDQVKVNYTLNLGEKKGIGLYPTIVVEKMFFFLLNHQSTYFKQNKSLLTNFFRKLKENQTEKKNDFYQQFSKYNYYVDENHTQLMDLYKIDNYAEILIKLTLKDDGDFDPYQLENKLIINLGINNLLSYTTKHNFINYSSINKQFQLKLAQYPQSISETILLSKLYEMNEIFVESLETTKMNDNGGCGVFLWNQKKQALNQEYQYSCHLQIQVPFTCIQDLCLSLNDTVILNGQQL
ncbi:unnamed protein product [Paramecium pentaurelia]|uniref:Bromo domain-containing protein n=1 Tax=Paramecium pentaurelia TaxID=43138 RepID=A0A8S1VCM7_9CILI|nr:unnamed protein product [Paramecium pentaurelia]